MLDKFQLSQQALNGRAVPPSAMAVEASKLAPGDTDPFARQQSAVATRYCTPLHDRHSTGFNVLLLDWSTPHVVYLNQPWNLLP
jgi:hypothetical protein